MVSWIASATSSSFLDVYKRQDAVTQGRTETEVLNELGDPRLIARTLLDTDSTASGNPQTTGCLLYTSRCV